MPDDAPQRRRLFSEKEISGVLRRAAEMQEAAGSADPHGLSLEELKEIAAETGIDPRYVAAAVAELERGATPEDKKFHFLGGPLSIDLERVVEGTLSETEWEEMIAETRRTLGSVGTVGRVGQTVEWVNQTGQHQQGHEHLSATSLGGQTRLRLSWRDSKWAILVHATLFALSVQAAVFIPAVLGLSFGGGLFVALSLMLGVFFVARFIYSQIVRRRETKLRALMDRLERIVEAPDAGPAAVPASTAQIDATLLDETATEEEAPEQTATRGRTSA